MNNNPQISVVMSVYSEPIEWIQESIDSILNQTFSDFEFIIINDNPNREVNKDLLDQYQLQDNRIAVIENKQNIGLTKSLNKGLKIAKGKYIARMDADDISMFERLQKQYDFMERNSDCVVCGANVQYFEGVNTVTKYEKNITDYMLFLKNPFAHPVVIIRGDVLRINQLCYDETYEYAQDYEFWSRLCDYGQFCNIQEVLLRYRVTSLQISKNNKFKQQDFAGVVRRKFFDRFCVKQNVEFRLNQNVDLSEIIRYDDSVLKAKEWSREVKNNLCLFKYYLYRSEKAKQPFRMLWYLISSRDFLKFSIGNSMKIIVFLFTNKLTVLVR